MSNIIKHLAGKHNQQKHAGPTTKDEHIALNQLFAKVVTKNLLAAGFTIERGKLPSGNETNVLTYPGAFKCNVDDIDLEARSFNTGVGEFALFEFEPLLPVDGTKIVDGVDKIATIVAQAGLDLRNNGVGARVKLPVDARIGLALFADRRVNNQDNWLLDINYSLNTTPAAIDGAVDRCLKTSYIQNKLKGKDPLVADALRKNLKTSFFDFAQHLNATPTEGLPHVNKMLDEYPAAMFMLSQGWYDSERPFLYCYQPPTNYPAFDEE